MKLIISAVLVASVAAGCRAQPSLPKASAAELFAPAETRSLRSFGAAGDGRADDTAAVQHAFRSSGKFCLDGEGHTYRVSGTLQIESNLCLRNTALLQSLIPFDTSPYITAKCPVTTNASAVIDCRDPAIPPDRLPRLEQSLFVRTLLIRPPDASGRIRVNLDRVKVDRGRYPEAGSRPDSAGIWIEGAERVDLNDVEITGYGKGYGLFVIRSNRINADNLWIHDLVWAPYPGDEPLTVARVSKVGWNAVSIREFRVAGSDGVKISKFYGVRIQEQVSCAVFSDVHVVRIRNVRISRCMARFGSGDLPWQADGLDISGTSSNVSVDGARIDSTWEAMDVVANGNGIRNLVISDVTATNSFSFGLKLGYRLQGAHLSGIKIDNAGIAGVVLYGRVADVSIAGVTMTGIGSVLDPTGHAFAPWPAGNRAGFRIDGHSDGPDAGYPKRIDIVDATVTGGAGGARYDFGILNTGGDEIQVRNFRAQDFSKSRLFGVGER